MAQFTIGQKWQEHKLGLFNRLGRLLILQDDPFDGQDVLKSEKVLPVDIDCEVISRRWSCISHEYTPVVRRVESVNGIALIDRGAAGTFLA